MDKKLQDENVKDKKIRKISDSDLEKVTGGVSQKMSIYCNSCGKNFTADISQDVIFCTHCGTSHFLFG